MADSQVLKALLPDNPLCGISTYKDTLNLATGACTRQIYKLVLHGTESYGKNVTGTYQYYMAVNPLHKKVPICVCSHLPSVDDYPADVIGVHTTRWASNAVYLNFGEDVMLAQPSGNTVDGLKEYITAQYNAGTPVTIWYIMETATTETIPVSSGLTGTVDGYLTQSGTPSPSAPIYPTANTVNVWVHSLRKLTTATEAVESPLYSDGTAITAYTIKGNTVQSGTPTPSNPVEVNGVGNKTANLFNIANVVQQPNILSVSGTTITKADNTTYNIDLFSGNSGASTAMSNKSLVLEAGTYTLSCDVVTGATNMFLIVVCPYTSATLEPVDKYFDGYNGKSFTLAEKSYVSLRIQQNSAVVVKDIMITSGSQSPTSYIPYGYEIPISSNQTALTPVYLTEQLMKIGDTVDSLVSTGTATYNIKKLVLTGQESFWSDDGTSGNRSLYRILPTGTDAILRGNRDDLYCTHFKTDSHFSANSVLIYNGIIGVFIYFYVPTADYPTLADFKTYIQQQYANGTPVILYYILATPTTETITAPSIPTTDGANTITVDTTVQPSEFTATWTGWHDSSVKEYDGSDWQ